MKTLLLTAAAFLLWVTSAAAQTHTFNLSWTLGSGDTGGIKVERKTGATGTYAQIAQLGPVTSTQNVVQNPAPGSIQYCFRIRAFNSAGDSPYSNEACGATAAVVIPTPPNAPSGFTVSAISSSTLRLSWADNSTNETGFQIQGKRATGQPYATIANLGVDTTTFDWTSLLRYKTYCAQVRAVGVGGNSIWTPVSCGTTSK